MTSPTSAPTTASVVPSVHIRALATWLTIFPLVAIGMTVMAPVTGEWHPVLRALVLTAVVVPLAVYFVVPRVIALLMRARRR
jgi:antibiotic biosynthesis monooxygenase (ABM) superfamily enzyme